MPKCNEVICRSVISGVEMSYLQTIRGYHQGRIRYSIAPYED